MQLRKLKEYANRRFACLISFSEDRICQRHGSSWFLFFITEHAHHMSYSSLSESQNKGCMYKSSNEVVLFISKTSAMCLAFFLFFDKIEPN